MRPHRWQPTRLCCPWDSPGKNTGVGCHFLLQGVKVKSESEVAQLCPTLSDPMDCCPPASSIHGIFFFFFFEEGDWAFIILNQSTIVRQHLLVSSVQHNDWVFAHGRLWFLNLLNSRRRARSSSLGLYSGILLLFSFHGICLVHIDCWGSISWNNRQELVAVVPKEGPAHRWLITRTWT